MIHYPKALWKRVRKENKVAHFLEVTVRVVVAGDKKDIVPATREIGSFITGPFKSPTEAVHKAKQLRIVDPQIKLSTMGVDEEYVGDCHVWTPETAHQAVQQIIFKWLEQFSS